MGNDIVKYHNDMNKVNFSSFSQKELDLFFSICFKLKELGTREVKFSFDDIKFLIGEVDNPKRVRTHIDNLNKKLAQLNCQIELEHNVFERFVLFTNFVTNFNNNTLTIKVNERFGYILNNLVKNFTKFDLIEFVSLKSSYSKNLFKLLKQWESTREKEFTIDEFRDILGVPASYNTSKFNDKILKPIMSELPQYFKNLRLDKIKDGRKVVALKFSWDKKKVEPKVEDEIQEENYEIKISKELYEAMVKAKKNRYLATILNLDNLETLLNIFNEKELIKGLRYAYNEIKREITSLNYLIKTIKTGLAWREKKLVVEDVEEIKPVEKEEREEKEIVVERKKISRSEYEELYKEHLEKNGVGNSSFLRMTFDVMNSKVYEIIEENEKIYEIEELDEKLLLSKMGKKLVGTVLERRLGKIAREKKIKIRYNGIIIGG